MSKKLAGGADAIVLDVKVGDGAFMKTLEDAQRARRGDARARRPRRPRGRLPAHRHGPAARAARSATRSRSARRSRRSRGEGPADFTELVLDARSRTCSRSPTSASTRPRAAGAPRHAVADGSALAAYERWIRAQGGDPDEAALPRAPVVREVYAPPRRLSSQRLGAIAIGVAALHLGAGRRTKEDPIDHAVGIVCRASAATRSRRARCSPRCTRATRTRPPRRRPRCSPRTSSATSRRAERSIVLDVDRRSARASRGRDRARPAGRAPRGAADRRGADRRSAADAARTIRRGSRRGCRRARRRGRAARQVPGRPARRRATCSLVHLRMTGGFRYEPASHERAVLELDDGTRIAYRDLRRFGTWLLLDPDEAEDAPRRPARPRAARARLHDRLPRGAPRRPAGARQGGDPRPAHRRRSREHLRGRGALARRHPSAAAGGRARAPRRSRRSARASGGRCASASGARAPTSATAPTPAGGCSTSSASTAARASRATAAGRRSRRPAPAAAARGTAPRCQVSDGDVRRHRHASRLARI